MRVVAIVLALAGLASACTCDAPPTTEPVATEPAPGESAALPRATRGDLRPATPMLTITVRGAGFEVDNRTLVETWPAPDRERVEAALGTSPQMHREIEAYGEHLELDSLTAAMQRAQEIERARAAGASTPLAYALRVAAGAPWRRVEQALWSAARAGFSEPRFVLRNADGHDVMLAVVDSEALPGPSRRRIELELAEGLGRLTDPEAQELRDLRVQDATRQVDAMLRHPVRVAIDASGAISIEGIPSCDTLARCVAALPDDRRVVLAADAALRAGDVIAVLETLAARGDVALEGVLEPPVGHR